MKNLPQVVLGVLLGLLGAGVLQGVNAPPRGEAVQLLPPPSPPPLVVHVSGAVRSPGVYTLPPESRIRDAVDAAGGFSGEAFTETLNLAAFLQDGQQLRIPTTEEQAAAVSADGQGGGSANPAQAFPININTAGLAELDLLPGIGPAKAQAIISYREEHGPFQTIEEIQNVPGIGPATFDALKDLITVGNAP
jgi:competence protein ComEA